MSTQTVPQSTPRGAFRLIIDPAFGALFWGKLLTTTGVWIHGIVAAIVVYDATRSALMVGLVGVAQFGLQIVLNPLSGKLADRGDALRQLLIGRIVCFVGSASLAVWTVLAPRAEGLAVAVPVLAATLLVGLGFVIGGPAMQSIVPSLLRAGELSTAMALNSIPLTVARMGGPVMGALVLSHLGPVAAFSISACGHLIFIILLVVVRFPPTSRHRSDVDYRVRAALQYVWADRPLFLLLLAVAIVGFGSDPSMTLAPSMAEELGGGTRLVGWLSAAFGAGAALGLVAMAILRTRLSSAVTATLGLWLLGAGLAIVAFSPWTAMAMSGFAIAGCGFSWGITGLSTLVQARAPDELRGRIMALWLVGFVGSRPVASTLLGSTADMVSVRAAFVVAAFVTLVVALLCRPRLLVRPGPVPLLQ